MEKIAVMTGGSRGIGYAVARQLRLDRYRIVILATGNRMVYQRALDRLTRCGITWHYVQGSITLAENRERLVRENVGRFGRIDIFVNNARVAPKERKDLLEMTEGSFNGVIGINIKGTTPLIQLVVKQMINQEQAFENEGCIVNVGSCLTEVSSITGGEYCTSKTAVCMLTTLLVSRLASEGIVVNKVRPGTIAAGMTSTVTDKYGRMIADGGIPTACWGKPGDMAQMMSLFCSDKVLYTTGNYIDVNGGFHIKRL